MNTKGSRIVVLFFLLIFSSIYFHPTGARIASIVWEEDFVGDLSDWEFSGFTISDFSPSTGNFTHTDGVLRITGENSQENVAEHASTQTTGTWSFDVDVTESPRDHFYIAFFGEEFGNLSEDEGWQPPYQYGVAVVTGSLGMWHSEFVFYIRPSSSNIIELGSYSPSQLLGWHHFDITRNNEGEFNIYIGSALRASFQDTTYNSTEVFSFSGGPGPGIDNIVVQDEIVVPQPTPSSFEFLAISLLLLGLVRKKRNKLRSK